MKILALDTATEACSAAVYAYGEILDRFRVAPRRHADLILPMVDELLDEAGLKLADLDALAFGAGPGSFTGVRIAAAVIQGLALGSGLPVVGISTLAELAQGAMEVLGHPAIAASLDARMGEVYFGLYRRGETGLAELMGEERVCPPHAVPALPSAGWFGVGSGWGSHGHALRETLGQAVVGSQNDFFPHARHLVQLACYRFEQGQALTPDQIGPNYVRHDIVRQPDKTFHRR